MKRFISVLLACAMCTLFSTGVFAAEEPQIVPTKEVTEITESNDEVTEVNAGENERALGTLLATNGGTIYNGMGSIQVYLPSGNFSADFVAVLGYCEVNTVVSCSVRDPNGNIYDLGSIAGNGSSTNAYSVFYASSGTYTFIFDAGTSSPIEVACFIYD